MMKQQFKNAKRASILLLTIFFLSSLTIFIQSCGDDGTELPAVTASFTETVNNTTGEVTFKNTSTNATIYVWNLGDGTTSALFEPKKTYQTGKYTVKLTASNTAGGTASAERTFDVTLPGPPVDTTKPIITLVGDATINLTVGDPYTDKGATATDNLDGTITAKIVKGGGTVTTTAAGTFTITYDVTDLAGNAAVRVTRTVIVTAFDDGLLNNGAFSIVKGQAGDAWSGNAFNVINEGGTNFNFANVATAGDAFSVNLSQVLPLEQGKNYKLTFEASSDRARTMVAGIGLSVDPWTNDVKTVNLTTTKQTITLDLFAAAFGGANSRVIFDMGAAVGVVVIDNVKLVEGPATPKPTPTTSAPTPPDRAAADVISIYGGKYTTLAGINYNPDWGQSGKAFVKTDFNPGDGNLALAYPNFNYQGTDLSGNTDASAMNFLHVDIWVAPGTNRLVKVSPINEGGVAEVLVVVPVTPGAWNSVDLPKSSFTGMTWNAVKQMKFDGQFNSDGSANTTPFDVYLDNIYFYKTAGGGGSTCPAPPAGEFIKDGGFEANAGCWELFATQAGTASTIVTNVNNGGTNSARIKTAQAGNPGIKQTRLGAGVILPNTTYVVKFDVRQDATDQVASGAVFKVAAFSEGADGSSTPATRHELVAGDGSVPTAWTTRTITFTTASGAANVAGGVSLLLELVGGGPTTTGTIYIDNVSLTRQ